MADRPLRVLLSYVGKLDWFPLSLDLLAGYSQNQIELRNRIEFRIAAYGEEEAGGRNSARYPFKTFVRDFAAFRPDIVALSAYVWNIDSTLKLASILKELDPTLRVIVGGPNMASAEHTEFLMRTTPAVDVSVRNEGEVTFAELLRHYVSGESAEALSDVLGISYRTADGLVQSTPRRPDVLDMDSLVFPYANRAFMQHQPHDAVMLETFRGCYRSCRFCVWSQDKPRAWSTEAIDSELRAIMQMGFRDCYIVDSEFGIKKDVFKHYLRLIIEHNNRTRFSFFPQIGFLKDDECLELIKESKVQLISFGLQSVNEMALRIMDRKQSLKRYEEVVEKLAEHGIMFMDTNLIYGLPGDSYESFRDGIEYVIQKTNQQLMLFHFCALPGTEFWDEKEKFGMKWMPTAPYYILESNTYPQADIFKSALLQKAVYTIHHRVPQLLRQLQSRTGKRFTQMLEEFAAKSRVFRQQVEQHGLNESGLQASYDEVLASIFDFIEIHAGVISSTERDLFRSLARFETARYYSERALHGAEEGVSGGGTEYDDHTLVRTAKNLHREVLTHDIASGLERGDLLGSPEIPARMVFCSGVAFRVDAIPEYTLRLARDPIRVGELRSMLIDAHRLDLTQADALIAALFENHFLYVVPAPEETTNRTPTPFGDEIFASSEIRAAEKTSEQDALDPPRRLHVV